MQNANANYMILARYPSDCDMEQVVKSFFSSLEWIYVAHRYDVNIQKNLVRLLTLSGLDIQWWRHCCLAVLIPAVPDNTLLSSVQGTEDHGQSVWLEEGVKKIWSYADKHGATVSEPPLRPSYLMDFGYTQENYVVDLRRVYAQISISQYEVSWCEPQIEQKTQLQGRLNLLQQGAAVMGATARAIEQLLA